jgi:UDP-glucose 4-epimerase
LDVGMRVLVTGASGYVGHATIRALLTAGHSVRALAHLVQPPPLPGVEWHRGALLDPTTLGSAVADIEGVVHLAAVTRVRESFEQPDRYYRTNVTGTLNLLDRLSPGTRFVLASTASVYGAPADQPITEDTPFDPQNPYAATKAVTEDALRWISQTGRVAASTLRIFNICGAVDGRADTDDTRILPRTVMVAAGQLSHVDVYGTGAAIRDFVHVSDVAAAITLALEHAAPGHRAFNVGAVPASVTEIIATVERVTGRAVTLVHHDPHAGEAPELRADTTRIREDLGWLPKHTTLDTIVADQWDAVR